MRLEDAKQFYDHEDEQDLECDTDGCDGVMVKWEGDKVCRKCGYMYEANSPEHIQDDVMLSERRVVSFRNRDGSGYYGGDRVRFVGGFHSAWFDENGALQL